MRRLLLGGLVLVLAVGARLRFATAAGVVDADESVVFLMARRIAALRDLPLFHYGNAYLGSLDALLAGAVMRVAGESAMAGRLVPLLLSLLFVWTTYTVGRSVSGRGPATVAAVYVAVGPALLVIWGAKLHLGYLDLLILGNLLHVTLLRFTDPASRSGARRWRWMAGAGFLCGLGIWCHILFVVLIASAGLFLAVQARREGGKWWRPLRPSETLAATLAFAVGAAPLIGWNLAHAGATVDLFRRGLQGTVGLPVRVASAAYNLLVACLPILVGGELPWWMHRSEMVVLLPEPVAVLALWLVVLVAGGVAAWRSGPWRGDGSRPARVRRLVFFVACTGLTATALVALGRVGVGTAWSEYRFPPNRRNPVVSLPLLRQELLDPRLLLLGLWALPCVSFLVGWRGARVEPDPPAGQEQGMAPARAPNDALARARLLFLCTSVSSILFYVGTSYGLLRSPRFLFPLYCVLPVVLGVGTSEIWQRSRPLAALLLSTVLGCNLAVQLAAHPALALQPVHYVGQLDVPQSYRELVSCLDGLGVDRVYGGYWTSFPLVLASQERILVSHGAPGRLPEADRAVAAATRVAFLFYRGKLDEMQFRVLLGRAGVRNRAWDCGPFRLYTEIDADALRRSPLWGRVLAVLAHP